MFNGLSKLGISIDEVDIDVVQNETRGVFGLGAKPAIVKLTVRDTIDVKELLRISPKARRARSGITSKAGIRRKTRDAGSYSAGRKRNRSDDNNFKYAHKNNQNNSGYRNNKNQRFRSSLFRMLTAASVFRGLAKTVKPEILDRAVRKWACKQPYWRNKRAAFEDRYRRARRNYRVQGRNIRRVNT